MTTPLRLEFGLFTDISYENQSDFFTLSTGHWLTLFPSTFLKDQFPRNALTSHPKISHD